MIRLFKNIIELIKKFIRFIKKLFKKTNHYPIIDDHKNYIGSQKVEVNTGFKPKPSEDEENFIKKDDSKNISSSQNIAKNQEVKEIIDILRKTKIRPLTNQQRNLDREEGGVEHEEKETEIHVDDNWDKRGGEIEEMANSHPINKSSAKKSMLWNLKRRLAQQKKLQEEIVDASKDLKKAKIEQSQDGNFFDSRKTQSIKQKIQGLKEDKADLKPPSRTR